ncbi:MAG TPA: DNA internalization-related competence protein ComEC/Rec2 [Vicinamibacterales bacterium]|jgi:competence protein ComEC
MRAPAALLALPLAAGCGIGLLLFESEQFAVRLAAAAALCALAAMACCADDRPADATSCVVLGALVAGISLGVTSARRAYHPPLLAWFESAGADAHASVTLRGTLREDAAASAAGVSLAMDVTHAGTVRASGGVRLSVAGALAIDAMREWRAGRHVRVIASLRAPIAYVNPGVPDERRSLARRGVALVGSVKSAALVDVVSRGSPIDEWSARVRAWTRSAIARSVGPWSERSAGIATAIVIGDRTGLSQEDERRLQEAGTYHVIAISGGNVAILAVLILAFLRAVRVPRKWASALTIVALLAYSRVTVAAPSVDRAIAAAVIVLIGRLIEQHGPSLNVLGVAASIALAVSPVTAFDPGFLLSFGATAAILVGVAASRASSRSNSASSRARAAPSLVRACRGLLTATIAAELALGPMTAALFGRITIAGLLLNFAAIPLMSIVQSGSLAALAASAIDPRAAFWSGSIVHGAARGLVDSARLMEVAPWLAREVAPPSWPIVVIYYAALVTAVSIPRMRRGAISVVMLSALVIVIAPQATARDGIASAPRGTLRVAFLDVGQGDATLIVLPDGRAMLVDAGGLPAAPLRDPSDAAAFDIGERVVAPALRAFGVRSLETLVLTHGDPDHIGGAPAIVRSFRPRAIWEGITVPRHAPVALMREYALARGAEWRNVQTADRIHVAGVDVIALHPPQPEWERQRVRNDDSVVLMLTYGAVSVILPGDIGREGESAVLRHVRRSRLTLLKVPHHGSATSSTWEFVRAVNPSAVIVSAGRDNRFGHPAPVVVDRYRTIGAAIFSTAADGAVIVDIDGTNALITGWGSRRSLLVGLPNGLPVGTMNTMTR